MISKGIMDQEGKVVQSKFLSVFVRVFFVSLGETCSEHFADRIPMSARDLPFALRTENKGF